MKISSKIFFHGLKKIGNELNSMYRMADIYVLPSHHEGFPRTIWEAMANSLPVISTTVGSIPKYLKNNKHAILVPPKDPNALYYAIKLMISNTKLRNELVENSFQLVSNHTLELQTKKLMKIISKELKSINKSE
jgi:glycosyltransferase involved in cell wall biosynthesis